MKPTDAHIASALRTDLHAYRAYGLTVGCDFEAPELTPVESEALDVRVVRARLPRPIPDVAEGIVFDFSDPAGLYFGWPLLGHFLLLEDGLILKSQAHLFASRAASWHAGARELRDTIANRLDTS